MATIPIHNPQLPFLGLIPGGLRPSVMLRFRGVVGHEGRIQINIQCGPVTNPRDDVALHLSLRPRENCLVRNSWQHHAWGPEERHGHFPVYSGQPFDILVLAEAHQYKIAVNGVHFCTFSHRIPLSRVRFVDVSGDGSISFVGIEGDSGPMPSAPPPVTNITIMPPMPPHGGVHVLPHHPPHFGPPNPAFRPNPGYPAGGGISAYESSYPSSGPSTDPHRVPFKHQAQSLLSSAKSIVNNVSSKVGSLVSPPSSYHHPQSNPSHLSYGPGFRPPPVSQAPYPTQPQHGIPNTMPMQGAYPIQPGAPHGYPVQTGVPQGYPGAPHGSSIGATSQHSNSNKGLLGALGGGTAAALLTGAMLHGKPKKLKKLKKNKALKYAAGAGVLGAAGYGLHKTFHRSSSSSSSSSSD